MRWLAVILVLASTAEAQSRFGRCRSGPGRSDRGFPCGQSFVSLADALLPGDLAGAWWAMRGDGTMRSGSAVTLVATGTPTNTIEAGWPVRTYTAAQNDQEPANAAFPASDFSVCIHHRSAALPNAQLMAFGTGGSAAAAVNLPFEQQVSGSFISYISDGGVFSTFASGASSAGSWFVLCFTYQRVGAGTSVGTLYVNGVQAGQSTTMGLAQALSSVWSTNGYAGAIGGSAGSIRGAFVTYKLLSALDVARISTAVGP